MKGKGLYIIDLTLVAVAAIVGIFYPSDVGMAWISTAIGAGMGVLSSLYGGAKSADAARKAQRELDKKEARDNAWYARRYNQNYLDTAAGQNLVNTALANELKSTRRTDGQSKVGSLTASAAAKQKEQSKKMLGDTYAAIAAGDTTRKMQVDQMHRQDMHNNSTARMGIYNNQAANITAAAGQASNALIGAGALADNKGDDFWKGLRNKSGGNPVTTPPFNPGKNPFKPDDSRLLG